jgi:uncharacterized membrane protein
MFESAVRSFYDLLNAMGYHHPVHPILVHMTIGLSAGAFLFSLAGVLFPNKALRQSGFHCIALALVFVLPTMVLGLLDWAHFYASVWIFPVKMKLILAVALFLFLVTGTLLGLRAKDVTPTALVLYALCFLNVIGMGYFGGELVYGSKPSPAANSSSQAGEQSYRKNCSACHPNGGNTIDPDLPVKGSPKLTDFDSFLSWIRNPNPGMPPYPESRISEKESRELYEYVAKEFKK